MKTSIYQTKEAFDARTDKKENGVDQDFADSNPGWDAETGNEGCWNCSDCVGCRECEGCDVCKECLRCKACASCHACLKCVACEGCTECVNCTCCVTIKEKAISRAPKSGRVRRFFGAVGRGIAWPFRKVGSMIPFRIRKS